MAEKIFFDPMKTFYIYHIILNKSLGSFLGRFRAGGTVIPLVAPHVDPQSVHGDDLLRNKWEPARSLSGTWSRLCSAIYCKWIVKNYLLKRRQLACYVTQFFMNLCLSLIPLFYLRFSYMGYRNRTKELSSYLTVLSSFFLFPFAFANETLHKRLTVYLIFIFVIYKVL